MKIGHKFGPYFQHRHNLRYTIFPQTPDNLIFPHISLGTILLLKSSNFAYEFLLFIGKMINARVGLIKHKRKFVYEGWFEDVEDCDLLLVGAH